MKELHIFIDESGEFGFSNDSSKRLIITFVCHDARDDITEKCQKIIYLDYIHVQPLIRRHDPYSDEDMETRIRTFRKFYIFFMSLPIKSTSFIYEKDKFNWNEALLEKQMLQDFYDFFSKENPYLKRFNKIVIYYDKGQRKISQLVDKALSACGLNYLFKPDVKAEKYRLFQVADLITTIKLTECKMNDEGMSTAETKFFGNPRQFKKNYLLAIEKKEIIWRRTERVKR